MTLLSTLYIVRSVFTLYVTLSDTAQYIVYSEVSIYSLVSRAAVCPAGPVTIHSPTVAQWCESARGEYNQTGEIHTTDNMLTNILILTLCWTVSTAKQDGGHHPNSVYSQISAHSKKDLRIFYQNGVSEREREREIGSVGSGFGVCRDGETGVLS